MWSRRSSRSLKRSAPASWSLAGWVRVSSSRPAPGTPTRRRGPTTNYAGTWPLHPAGPRGPDRRRHRPHDHRRPHHRERRRPRQHRRYPDPPQLRARGRDRRHLAVAALAVSPNPERQRTTRELLGAGGNEAIRRALHDLDDRALSLSAEERLACAAHEAVPPLRPDQRTGRWLGKQ